MAITFTKQKKIQKNLILAFAFIVIIIFFILWQGFLKEAPLVFDEEAPIFPEKDIEINFKIFEQPKAQKLVPFSEIEPFEEIPATEDEPGQAKGRENPFIPY